tara:strand:+ start:367 stop:540 length:174 start_codon:yes stop_codon:yes gene_type:complete
MFVYLHAPRRINANPPNPRSAMNAAPRGPWPTIRNDDSRVVIVAYEPENNHVVTIDL